MIMSEKKWGKFPCSNCKYIEYDGTVDKNRCSRCRRTYKTEQGEKIREQEVELVDLRYKLEQLELMIQEQQEPTKAYLTEANRNKAGRTPKVKDDKDIALLTDLVNKGLSTRAIAKELGISKNTVTNMIKKLQLK